jgi:isopenicillin-N N-acyltransferase like protein
MSRPCLTPGLVFVLLSLVPGARAGEPFRYPEGHHGKGELRYVNGLPVLAIEGTPEEMGEQTAALTARPAARLLDYPRAFLRSQHLEATWPALLLMSRSMAPHFPPRYLRELDAGVKASGVNRDLVVLANTVFDIKKIAGCSALLVDPERSATRGPLFGRNLDFPTLGYLQEYSLVVVARPEGKHAFASVGFPGLIGCLSGMNDAGLALSILEVYAARDGASKFDPTGTPYALCFRRILEECTTVEEAERLVRSMKRTTMLNLAVCDVRGGVVFEMTPRSVVVRRPREGLCACTNHFRTPELATSLRCSRYDALEESRKLQTLGLADVQRRLHAANQGALTLQTMVFESAQLRLHLAIGRCPSSALPLKTLDLAAVFQKEPLAERSVR